MILARTLVSFCLQAKHGVREIDSKQFQCFSPLSDNSDEFRQRLLKPLLIPRVSGTPGNAQARQHIVSTLRSTNMWHVDFDTFDATTPVSREHDFSSQQRRRLNAGRSGRVHEHHRHAGSDSYSSSRARLPSRLEEAAELHRCNRQRRALRHAVGHCAEPATATERTEAKRE